MDNAYELGRKKVASMADVVNTLSRKEVGDAVGTAVKGLQLAGAGLMTGIGLAAIFRKIQNSLRHKALVEDLMQTDPIIKQGDPQEVLQFYAMIYNMAPRMALERPVVRELLQNYVRVGRVDMQTLKTITETEEKLGKIESGSMKAMLGF